VLKLILSLMLIACASLGMAAEKKHATAKKDTTAKAALDTTGGLATIDDTIRALKTAIAKDPARVSSHYDLGLIYYINKQWYAKTIEEWNKVAQLTPKDGKIYFQMAWTFYRKLKNLQGAENEALAAMNLGKADKEKKYWYGLSVWILASIYEEKGDSLNAQRYHDEWQQLAELSQKPDNSLDYLKQEVDALKKNLNINKQ
jgi:tetratricopeptide (TPR) repeat protein